MGYAYYDADALLLNCIQESDFYLQKSWIHFYVIYKKNRINKEALSDVNQMEWLYLKGCIDIEEVGIM